MSTPKRRHSKTRGRKRRTHYKLEKQSVVKCSNCGSIVLPHHVCSNCGFYKGRQIIVKKEKDKKPKR